ncbi:MerC domain-containing protein [Catalinimonas niigatensis]|uniref:MerC domain-containing protein n=1 Tax=Catalinimonas niigatensis TaxID=1397264 RepID=UPI002667011D|nr:MerC domain-containing protein [Catalinimonas niigatensis]WPP52080.1 MerC domain-containing protein [Catalinimonas niigatensis]
MLFAESKADTIGIFSSVLCLVHCLLVPLFIFGGLLNEEWGAHAQWVDYLFILLAIGAVFFASRQSDMYALKVFMWITVSWFSISILLHDVFETALYSSMVASIALVVLHSINFRRHQQQHHAKKATA